MLQSDSESYDPRPDEEMADKNLFMMCEKLNHDACSDLPPAYHIRRCREEELETWKTMHFDDPVQAKEYHAYMTGYFEREYAPHGNAFYERCRFVCDTRDVPIATAFIWRIYGEFNTIHWLKVRKSHEDQGIGRALLSHLLQNLPQGDYPVYLHTQPTSYRAVKLYSDFGFVLLTDPVVGCRSNDLSAGLPFLENHMPKKEFRKLRTGRAPAKFIARLRGEPYSRF